MVQISVILRSITKALSPLIVEGFFIIPGNLKMQNILTEYHHIAVYNINFISRNVYSR